MGILSWFDFPAKSNSANIVSSFSNGLFRPLTTERHCSKSPKLLGKVYLFTSKGGTICTYVNKNEEQP